MYLEPHAGLHDIHEFHCTQIIRISFVYLNFSNLSMNLSNLCILASLVSSKLEILPRPRIDTKISLSQFLPSKKDELQRSFVQQHVMVAARHADGTLITGGNDRCKGCDGVPCPDLTEKGYSVKSMRCCICDPGWILCEKCFLWHTMTREAKMQVIANQTMGQQLQHPRHGEAVPQSKVRTA